MFDESVYSMIPTEKLYSKYNTTSTFTEFTVGFPNIRQSIFASLCAHPLHYINIFFFQNICPFLRFSMIKCELLFCYTTTRSVLVLKIVPSKKMSLFTPAIFGDLKNFAREQQAKGMTLIDLSLGSPIFLHMPKFANIYLIEQV